MSAASELPRVGPSPAVLARRRRLGLAALVAAAIVVQLTLVIRILVAFGGTFQPHDYLAYDGAVRHLVSGQPLYDLSATETGGTGLFLYPPSFALVLLPIALIPTSLAAPIWLILLVAASVAGIWLMPVSRLVRWLLTLALGLSYPLLDAVSQGQVGPVLLLLLAIAWRWIDRPGIVGTAIALGATVKVQPAILVVWALATGRRRAAVIAVAIAGVLALVATVLVGPQAWLDFVTVVARTNRPVLTPHSVGLARVVYEAGLPESAAWTAYVANIVAVGAVFLVSLRRSTEVASFMVGAVASQMVSPVVWAHYAVVLFLPVAWLLSRERWWALLLLVPLSVPIAGMLPPVVYPIVFWVALAATAWEGRRGNVERLREQATPGSDAILAS